MQQPKRKEILTRKLGGFFKEICAVLIKLFVLKFAWFVKERIETSLMTPKPSAWKLITLLLSCRLQDLTEAFKKLEKWRLLMHIFSSKTQYQAWLVKGFLSFSKKRYIRVWNDRMSSGGAVKMKSTVSKPWEGRSEGIWPHLCSAVCHRLQRKGGRCHEASPPRIRGEMLLPHTAFSAAIDSLSKPGLKLVVKLVASFRQAGGKLVASRCQACGKLVSNWCRTGAELMASWYPSKVD